jgi:hypothetical protein
MSSKALGIIYVGDLVLPVDEREFLYSTPDKIESEEDPIDMIWNDEMPGIVIDILEFYPPREYYQIKVIVEDVIGWTYSDYVWRISD